MNKNFTTKKYFIDGFKDYIKNQHKSLSKIYIPSIRELLIDYIEIHNEITSNFELEKLEKSRKELLESMKYFIKNSIFNKDSLYKKELTLLINQIDKLSENDNQNKMSYASIHKICNSFIKKFNTRNIYTDIVNLVKMNDKLIESELAIHSLINELVFDGYSLRYLDSWAKEKLGVEVKEDTIDSILDRFCDLKRRKDTFVFYINIFESDYFNHDSTYIDFNILLVKQNYDELDLGFWKDGKERKRYLQEASGYQLCKIEITALDYYKGIEYILSSISSYFQMIAYVTTEKQNPQSLLLDKIVCKLPNDTYKNLRITDGTSADNKILFYKIENRERQDVEDFILYRGQVFSDNLKTQEVFNIQRALNIVKDQHHHSQENKIINLWAVLEYVLTFKESGGSIISKIKDIIPKITCLYIMKDKINIFWSRIFEYSDKDISIINEFLKCKKEGEQYQYDLKLLLSFIHEKGPKLADDLKFDNNLYRAFLEIGQFISNPKALFDYLENKKQEIKHDLVRSYRARNVLIHSGKETQANLDFKALRLYSYNNNLLGLIIYYLYRNPQFKITEILNSIDYTYENYIEGLKEGTIVPEEICKPKYLFIG
ncbi:hypothetical protein [Paenibacillus sinopodophylli]|uniref:hypothetical protein n=1 Tax=Paenibacillus sinopodophylli TaxID=1837342 RepID=UPI00110CBF04|nr:hypothetical protein [Paenibacillus sinopodophylli]